MNLVTVKLVNENDMFLFPSVGISLNFEILQSEIDVEKLSDVDYFSLQTAIVLRQLLVTGTIVDRYKKTISTPKPICPAIIPKIEHTNTITIVDPIGTRNRQIALVGLLKGTAKEIKVALDDIADLRELKFLLETERRGKERKGIIKLLNNAIIDFERTVQKTVLDESDARPMPKRFTGIGTAFEIEEEVIEDVIVPVPKKVENDPSKQYLDQILTEE
jgi:hypothetical protein